MSKTKIRRKVRTIVVSRYWKPIAKKKSDL